MFKFTDDKGKLRCSFCGKSQDQVKKLVAGPEVYICEECIDLCNEIIEEELYKPTEAEVDFKTLPKPKEIQDKSKLLALKGMSAASAISNLTLLYLFFFLAMSNMSSEISIPVTLQPFLANAKV